MRRSITRNILKCATQARRRNCCAAGAREQERVGNLIARARRCTEVHRDKRRQHFAAVGGRLDAAVRANIAAHRQRIVRDRETHRAHCSSAAALRRRG